jgi:predicted nucleic acid-binding Zn finger protein
MQQTAPILHSGSDNLSAIRTDGHYDCYHLFAIYLADLDDNMD